MVLGVVSTRLGGFEQSSLACHPEIALACHPEIASGLELGGFQQLPFFNLALA